MLRRMSFSGGVMIRYFVRLLAFLLFAGAAQATANAPAGCVDNWGLINGDPTPTCAALALKAVHERQLAAFEKARDVLGDADTWHPNRSADDIAAALGVLAESAAMAIRDYPPSMVPSPSDELARTLLWMRRDFQQQGWPEPADIPAGFRFLQARIQAAPASARKAIVTAGLRSARLMPYNGFLLDNMAHEHSKEDRQNHRKAEAAERADALKNSTYAERVIARFDGSRRFEGKAFGWRHFLEETALIAALLGFLLAYGALKNGESAVGIIRILLIIPPAIVVPGVLVFILMAFAPDIGFLGVALWIGGSVLMALRLSKKVRRILPDVGWTLHGSARWANFEDMLAARRVRQKDDVPQGFALGRAFDAPRRADPRLFYQGHVLTVAPTGAGKGVGAVIPNLLTYEGSAIVLDIKGENYAITARARAGMGQEICLIDPFGVTGARPQGFNWFNVIDVESQDCVSISESLAEMLVIPSEGGGGSDSVHFEETARELLRGLLLFVATLPPARRHMGELRRLITLPLEEFLEVLTDMALSKKAFGVIARAANSFAAKPERERGSVLSTAQRHTAFLDDPRIVAALERSDFTMADLKTRAKTVYIVLPPNKLAANSRFLRGFIGLALAAITSSTTRPEQPVVFMMDEFAQLGRMAAVEDAIAVVRGYGAAFWIFVQDLSQLRAVYPKWQTFLANAAQQYFAVADYDTAHYVSSMLGQRTVEFRTRGTSSPDFKFGHGSTSTSQHFTGRALLTPDEVMKSHGVIVFIAGERPYGLQRLNYLSDPEYAGLADPNPYFAREFVSG